MRLIVISLLAMFLAVLAMFLIVWPALNGPQGDFNKGLSAYEDGNYKTAIKWYHQAAEQGHAEAQHNLGLMYEDGKGVAQDYKTAIKWYRQAAEQGFAWAQSNLGVMYGLGQGVAKDYEKAVKLFRQAAEQGHAGAQYNLGRMYAEGRGVTQNIRMEYMFYLLALANLEDESVREEIEEVVTLAASILTTTQKQSAQNDAVEYQAKIDARQ